MVMGFLLLGCSTGTTLPQCAAEFPGDICLDLSSAGALVDYQSVVEDEVMRALDAIQPLLGVTGLRISLIDDRAGVIPEVGMGGFNPSTDEVRLYADPARPDLETILRSELLYQLAHETHHAMRRRAIGYGSTLLQAAVSEGLADHFAMEASGRASPPPWSVALTPDELATWIPEVESRNTGAYDHFDWFVGTSPEIPRWTGYAVGYELVRAYLDQNPASSASGLVGEPATSFVPYSP
jgi:uncharacterized protein YjaZ